MYVDVMTVPQPLAKIGELAQRTRAAGFSGLLLTETGRTAYLNAAVASQSAPGLELSTGVAVAFQRSPFVTAASAWELQEATGGRFRLGLGTQVRTHVVRRYGMPFEHPGPRLRDYVLAVKACFAAFRTGKLDHHGEFYELDFITPQWSPGPIDVPAPKVDIAAFATESTWDGLAEALTAKYAGIATRIVLYNALGGPERFERYGEIARQLSAA
ncbi:LLM class flavin-dependent oxidoreductase [Mycolicibacterium porcinum]